MRINALNLVIAAFAFSASTPAMAAGNASPVTVTHEGSAQPGYIQHGTIVTNSAGQTSSRWVGISDTNGVIAKDVILVGPNGGSVERTY